MTEVESAGRRDLLLLSCALFLALLAYSSYNAALPLIQIEWRLNNTGASLMFSAYLVGYALSALLIVPLTDRLPPRHLLRAGLLVMVASQLLFGSAAASAWSGAALRFVMGAGHVAAYTSAVQWVARRFPGRQRGTAVGLLVGAGYAGTTFSFVLMGWLLTWLEAWRPAYTLTAAAGLLGLILTLWLPPAGEERPAAPPAARPTLDLSLLRLRPLLLIVFAYALHTAELYLARLWFPQLLAAGLQQTGLPPLEAGARAATLAGWMFMTSIAAVFLGGRWSDRWGRARTGAFLFAVSGLCSLAAGWLLELPFSWLVGLGFLYGFSTAADSAIYSTAVTELSPAGRLGSAQAVQAFIGFAVGAAVPVAAGSLLDLFPEPAGWIFAFSFNGLLALIGVLCLVRLSRRSEAGNMAGGQG